MVIGEDPADLVIVQTSAAHFGVIEGEPQRADQVQGDTGIGCQSNDIARIGRNLWLNQHHMKPVPIVGRLHRMVRGGERLGHVWQSDRAG